jgi:DNA primase
MDDSQFRGEVIFTFDGDAAGQRAALRAFGMEEKFVTQTFVAVQPDGLDPCDLRLKLGDGAVRDLVARRVPLYEFAIRSAIEKYDPDNAEGRLGGLDAAAEIIARIKDNGRRKVYAGMVDRWLGLMDEDLVLSRINDHMRTGRRRDKGTAIRADALPAPRAELRPGKPGPQGSEFRAGSSYDLSDPVANLERQALKLAVQRPALCGPAFDELGADDFTVPVHAAMRDLIAGCGGVAGAGSAREWAERLRAGAPSDTARAFVTRLAVEPLQAPGAGGEPDARYADGVLAKVEELAISRQIAVVKSRLQRMNPVDEQAKYNRMFGDLVALEQRHRQLLERAAGAI